MARMSLSTVSRFCVRHQSPRDRKRRERLGPDSAGTRDQLWGSRSSAAKSPSADARFSRSRRCRGRAEAGATNSSKSPFIHRGLKRARRSSSRSGRRRRFDRRFPLVRRHQPLREAFPAPDQGATNPRRSKGLATSTSILHARGLQHRLDALLRRRSSFVQTIRAAPAVGAVTGATA
jgi:hypothetical protein